MKVFVKTVTSKTNMEVSIDENATVKELREEFAKTHNYAHPTQRSFTTTGALVFKGTVLKDDAQKLSAVGIVENETLIVVGKKQAEQPAPSAPAPVEEKKEEKKQEEEKEEEKKEEKEEGETVATAAGAFVMGDEMEETVTTIMSIGDWPRDKVVRALRAAFNNPDRAVDFLMNDNIPAGMGDMPMQAEGASTPAGAGSGAAATPAAPARPTAFSVPGIGTITPDMMTEIMGVISRGNNGQAPDPQTLMQFLTDLGRIQQAGAARRAAGAGPAAGAGAGAGEGGAALSPLAQQLSQIPEFNTIRQAIAQNPAQLQTLMQTLRQSGPPELYQLIQDNQQEFLQLLQTGIPGGEGGSGGPRQVEITPADNEAIDRLVQLTGCSRQQAEQAYVMAGGNEELAANLLFDDGGMMED